jgi:hypothetical protein
MENNGGNPEYSVRPIKSPFEGGRPLRNCPVGNFREEPDCRADFVVGEGDVDNDCILQEVSATFIQLKQNSNEKLHLYYPACNTLYFVQDQ